MKNDLTKSSKPGKPADPGRRRFMKGTSLAMPAVMTLHIQSVSATALDTFNRCTQNLASEDFIGVISSPDGCARVELDVYDYLGDGALGNYLEESTGGPAAFLDSESGVIRRYPDGDGGTGLEVVDFGDTTLWRVRPQQEWAIIRYDETDGLILSLGITGNGADQTVGIAMSGGMACWHSITANNW